MRSYLPPCKTQKEKKMYKEKSFVDLKFINRYKMITIEARVTSENDFKFELNVYCRSKKKRNTPIYFNTNYHRKMKLVSIIMD